MPQAKGFAECAVKESGLRWKFRTDALHGVVCLAGREKRRKSESILPRIAPLKASRTVFPSKKGGTAAQFALCWGRLRFFMHGRTYDRKNVSTQTI